jgi:hypothetical protein
MILLGCLLAFGLSVAPRLFLLLAWFFSERWARVWQGEFLIPLLGIIFLPYTTIMYMLVWDAAGIDGWDWLWIILGLLLDVFKWQQVIANREKGMEVAQGYYSSTSAGRTGGSTSTDSATYGSGTGGTTPTGTGTSGTSTGTTGTSPTGTGPTDEPPA